MVVPRQMFQSYGFARNFYEGEAGISQNGITTVNWLRDLHIIADIFALRLRCSVCSLIIHELQLSSVSSTTLIFISTHTEQ